jgi:protein-export membrane protein SecD
MKKQLLWLSVIIVLLLFSVWVSLPDNTGIHIDADNDGTNEVNFNVQQSLGLDLVGGLRVLLQAELPTDAFTIEELQQTANNVARRVNGLGVTEATVQVQGNNRILVELPGITDSQQAVNTIQETALLEFVDFSGLGGQAQQFEGQQILTSQQLLIEQQRQQAAQDSASNESAGVEEVQPPQGQVNPVTGQPFETIMDGSGLQAATAQYQNNQWYISFELTPEGTELFGPYTASHIGQPLAIVLDGVVLSAPVIQAQLDTGGIIEGSFTEPEAKQLALQLRSGALPIPLRVESAETVGATLGQESVTLSIRAGSIGVFIVLLFMLIYYRVPGIAADLALIVFIFLNLALFKLIPITLTLPAITGFLISIGTAVDGNILIFERIKEELRADKELDVAVESGFDRAWKSIRDSNFSTILICAVLFLFGQTPGASVVSGFAITLALGLLVNLFTAVIVTGTFLRIIVYLFRRPLEKRVWLLGA